jgi:hypothetical protein
MAVEVLNEMRRTGALSKAVRKRLFRWCQPTMPTQMAVVHLDRFSKPVQSSGYFFAVVWLRRLCRRCHI